MDEGYIKFQCEWEKTSALPESQIREVNQWRNRLYDAGLIGIYDNGVGYGNVSVRVHSSLGQFIITGTQTGGIERLTAAHYTLVTYYSLDNNQVYCQGPIKASSESMTHAVFYESDTEINAVVHGHHKNLWQHLLHRAPTSRANVAYGTPEMAQEVKRLFQQTGLSNDKTMVMAGHEDGIVTFGKSVKEASQILLSHLTEVF